MFPSSGFSDPTSDMRRKSHKMWEFRRRGNDFDSSSNDSKSSSSSERVLKKHKLVSNLISHESADTEYTPSFGSEDKYPGSDGQVKRSKAVKQQRGKMTWGSRKRVDRKHGKASVCEPEPEPAAASDDVKIFMESLLEEVKVARTNLLARMKEELNKLIVDNTSPHPTQGKRSYGEKTKLQTQKDFKENIQSIDLEDSVRVQHKKNFGSSMRAQKCNCDSLESIAEADRRNFDAALEDQVDSSPFFGPITSIQKEEGESLVSSVKPNVEINPLTQNPMVQHKKTIGCLGGITKSLENDKVSTNPSNQSRPVQHQNYTESSMISENCNGGSLMRSWKGKTTAKFNIYNQAMGNRDDYGQFIVPATSNATDDGQKLGLSVKPNHPSNFSSQVASSMYLALPNVLAESRLENSRLNTISLDSSIQLTTDGTSIDFYPETRNRMFNANDHSRYFPHKQQQERIQSYAQSQTGTGNLSCFNQNRIPTSSIGTWFPVSLQQGSGSCLGIAENNCVLGQQMNGGGLRSLWVNHGLSGNYAANNYQNPNIHDADLRLLAFQNSEFKEGQLFLK